MSNRYFNNWEKATKTNKDKSESLHLDLLERLDSDCKRLDRALDKIKTEEKAKRIFNQSQMVSPISQVHMVPQVQIIGSSHVLVQPVSIAGSNYMIVNGCVLMPRNNFF